uniref:Uncharacterized protein n=1 Tax=Anopheles albimanus TaxID=7167 RepID=A0A182FXP8_ANOAL
MCSGVVEAVPPFPLLNVFYGDLAKAPSDTTPRTEVILLSFTEGSICVVSGSTVCCS